MAPTRLGLASLAAGMPMGQQVYERELARRAPGELGPAWAVERIEVRSLRTTLPGTVRLPSGLLTGSAPALRRAAGRYLYRGFEVVHRLDLRLPPAPRAEVLTVLDLAPWRFADEGWAPADAAPTARRAEAVICPSGFSAEEVASRLGVGDPVVVPCGVEPRFFAPAPLTAAELAAVGLRPPFVVHAGGCSERKNLAGLAAAWPRVASAHPGTTLALLGPPDQRRDRLFAPLPGAVRLGRVGDDLVPRLMATAAAVVVPSLYEGFGLPALEGLAVGVPVVAADRGSLPEVCGGDAYLVEPDGAGLAEGLEAALAGGPETAAMVARGRERAAGFTWEATAAGHARVWRSVVG
jgi:glycosyltransferase involved in cell wall biosynthesis